jgi:hypothetical protein
MLDVVDQRGKCLLVRRRQTPFEFFRIEAGICPADRNNRSIDIGKDVGGRAQDDHWRGDENQQRENDKCVQPVESNFDDLHILRFLLSRSRLSLAFICIAARLTFSKLVFCTIHAIRLSS